MKDTLRHALKTGTKELHDNVEGLFNFSEGINANNLTLFYKTMLTVRHLCKPLLNSINATTFNDTLIAALKRDLGITHYVDLSKEHLDALPLLNTNNFSDQVGCFYVFAGSAAGAKILINSCKKQNLSFNMHYFEALVDSSAKQMASLKNLMDSDALNTANVVTAAQHTFTLIYKVGTYHLEHLKNTTTT